MSPIPALLALLRTAAPKVAPLLGPELIKWLANPVNRDKLRERLRAMKSRSRRERVRARILVTMDALEGIKENAEEPARVRFAEQGLTRAKKLLIMLDLPLSGREERKANLKSVESGLARLLDELKDDLGDQREGDDGRDSPPGDESAP